MLEIDRLHPGKVRPRHDTNEGVTRNTRITGHSL
jgi:hypothetical protein